MFELCRVVSEEDEVKDTKIPKIYLKLTQNAQMTQIFCVAIDVIGSQLWL